MGGIYGVQTLADILLVSVFLGGGAAWLTGRAIAQTWRPLWHAAGYIALLGCAVRYIHFALFQGELLSLPAYLADTAFLLIVGGIAWRVAYIGQMVRQYPWLYERTSPFTYQPRTGNPGNDGNTGAVSG
jgi:hypothetical protein